MKNKIFKTIAVSVMAVLMTAGVVTAAPSIVKNGAVSQNFTIGGVKVEGAKAGFTSDFTNVPAEVQTQLNSIIANPANVGEILKNVKVEGAEGIDISKLKGLSVAQDLVITDANGNKIDAKDVEITWEVPNLTTEVDGVRVLHYSTVRNVWELLTPSKVDTATKSITQKFADLSPVMVVYTDAKAGASAEGTTAKAASVTGAAKTGDSSPIMMYSIIGIGAAAVVIFAVAKKRKKA